MKSKPLNVVSRINRADFRRKVSWISRFRAQRSGSSATQRRRGDGRTFGTGSCASTSTVSVGFGPLFFFGLKHRGAIKSRSVVRNIRNVPAL